MAYGVAKWTCYGISVFKDSQYVGVDLADPNGENMALSYARYGTFDRQDPHPTTYEKAQAVIRWYVDVVRQGYRLTENDFIELRSAEKYVNFYQSHGFEHAIKYQGAWYTTTASGDTKEKPVEKKENASGSEMNLEELIAYYYAR